MSLRLANITFDCDNTLAVAEFWSAALGRPVDPDPSEHFASIGANGSGSDNESSGQTPSWYFSKVPESKSAKNRCHVDLAADDREAIADEVARLESLGATVIRPPQEEFGHYWSTLRDPEGNELCIGAP